MHLDPWAKETIHKHTTYRVLWENYNWFWTFISHYLSAQTSDEVTHNTLAACLLWKKWGSQIQAPTEQDHVVDNVLLDTRSHSLSSTHAEYTSFTAWSVLNTLCLVLEHLDCCFSLQQEMCQYFSEWCTLVCLLLFPIVPAVHNQKSEWANLAILQPHLQHLYQDASNFIEPVIFFHTT